MAGSTGSGAPLPDPWLAAELDRLAGMDMTNLRGRWRRSFGRAPGPDLPRSLLHRALAYRLQAETLGDLDRETARALDRMAEEDGAAMPPPERPERGVGTMLVREWQGTRHSVMVLEEGYAWNGATHTSLSDVAFAITGTKWSGPRFFGLKPKGEPSGRSRRSGPGSRDRRSRA